MLIKGNIVVFKSEDGDGYINIAVPVEIARIGLIEGEKDPERKTELQRLFWDSLVKWGKEKGHI